VCHFAKWHTRKPAIDGAPRKGQVAAAETPSACLWSPKIRFRKELFFRAQQFMPRAEGGATAKREFFAVAPPLLPAGACCAGGMCPAAKPVFLWDGCPELQQSEGTWASSSGGADEGLASS